jgi:hypothetical protein
MEDVTPSRAVRIGAQLLFAVLIALGAAVIIAIIWALVVLFG